ncbi:hypothetical protein [Nitratireductor sp. XY-223]|uniref:hypothetical protein n=1 Tax=Nitratireductor sp. XY-223 TaxID=2561926 RepID=UPI0010AABBBE|nr:hypothetical protein [Nitratireductor sp. XY-223]
MDISGFFGFVIDVASSLSDAFAKAVAEYPLVTIIVIIVVYSYFHKNGYLILFDFNSKKIILPKTVKSWIAIIVGFIVVAIVANVIGWILSTILNAIGRAFNMVGFFAASFDENPLEFTISFLIFAILGILYLWLRAGRQFNQISIIRAAVVGFVVLFCSYISSSLFVSIADLRDSPSIEEASQ